jgi:hypothetical protein
LCDRLDWSVVNVDAAELSKIDSTYIDVLEDHATMSCSDMNYGGDAVSLDIGAYAFISEKTSARIFESDYQYDSQARPEISEDVEKPWEDGFIAASTLMTTAEITSHYLIDNLIVVVNLRVPCDEDEADEVAADGVESVQALADQMREETEA